MLSLRKGNNDELRIRVKGAEKAEEFRTVLRNKMADLQIDLMSKNNRRMVVQLKDVVIDTTEQEVSDAVAQVIGGEEDFKIASVR